MLFMVSSRPKVGATREQLIQHLTRRLDPSTWDLIRKGVLSHILYKVGDEPGFFRSSQCIQLRGNESNRRCGYRAARFI